MSDTENHGKHRATFSEEFTQVIEGFGALALVYNLAAHAFNSVSGALSSSGEAAALPVLFSVGVAFGWGGILGDLILTCFAIGFITIFALRYICESDWIWGPVDVWGCWEEVTWNPWSWVKAIVCGFKEIFKWILQKICAWKYVLVTILVVGCILGAIAVA